LSTSENRKRRAFVVSHTHWDREWYLPFNRFRVNLVETVGKILGRLEADGDFKHFLLDGQTCVLEDYLDAVPGETERVRRLVQSGALASGPWYILPDEFLVSGEATVRNLIMGHRTGTRWGPVQKVGYMPDSFGHLAQLPQILRLAGLDSFVFTRGLGDEAEELGWLFRWQAPDGSEVLAVNQCEGYCNAGALGLDELWHSHTPRQVEPVKSVKKVSELLAKMDTRPGADPILLNNGCDHFPPQEYLGEILNLLNFEMPEVEFRQTGLAGFVAAVDQENLPTFSGELLGGKDHPILSGVWSARMYLKQQNEACQNLLTRQVEPLLALAASLHGVEWPTSLIDQAWKQLLLNHPHDSICGCSTDAVHADMETRFAAVLQTGEQLLSRTLEKLAPSFAPEADGDRQVMLTVANSLPRRRDAVVERLLILPTDLVAPEAGVHLQDEEGNTVACSIMEYRYLERFWGVDYRSQLHSSDQMEMVDTYLHRFGNRIIGDKDRKDTHDLFLLVRFMATDLPALGLKNYRLLAGPAPVPAAAKVSARKADGAALLENEHLQVRLHPDGTFDLRDRHTGRLFAGLNLLEDSADRGDEYDFCPAEQGLTVFSAGADGKVRLLDCDANLARAEATFRLDLPRSLNPDRNSRHPRTTPGDVSVRLTLAAGSRRVEVETAVNNRAFDHRLRAWFPTGLDTDQVISDGHFMLNSRPLQRPGGDDWVQPAPETWPQQDWSALKEAGEGGPGLAIFNRGLPEFQTWTDESSGGAIFALTLLRCVDWLSRDDLPTRNNINAGPTLHTPGAQCIGRHLFRYAVAPFCGDVLAADLPGQSQDFRNPLLVRQCVAEGLVPGDASLVAKTDPRVELTAIRQVGPARNLELRLVNLAATEVTEVLEFGPLVVDAEKVGFLGGPPEIHEQPVFVSEGGEKLRVPLAPFEIATILVELENSTPET
jgi:mannosylglycerate hydrolase